MEENDAKGHRQRLKMRWLKAGKDGFSDHESLELLLSYAIPRKDTKPLAKRLIKRFGSLNKVLLAPMASLAAEKDMGEHSAILLGLSAHLASHLKHEEILGQVIKSSEDIADHFKEKLGHLPIEYFHLVLLNQQNRIIDCIELEKGIENRAHVYIKQVIRYCFDRNATAIICIHNHPSGQTAFSPADLELTKRIKKVLDEIEIRFLDHLLVAHQRVVSMREMHPNAFKASRVK